MACVNVEELLVRKFVSPLYMAVIEWVPWARLEVWKVAWPVASRLLVPSVTVPSIKVTVPVGMPAPGLRAVTVAVNVIICPMAAGFADEESVVAVLAWLTICDKTAEVLGPRAVSPL